MITRRIGVVGFLALLASICATSLVIWNARGCSTTEQAERRYPIWCIAVAPDGKQLVCGSGFEAGSLYGRVQIWNLVDENDPIIKELKDVIGTISFDHKGGRLVTGGFHGEVCVWDHTMTERLTSFNHSGTVTSTKFSPDGKLLAAAALSSKKEESEVRLWDLATSKEIRRLGLGQGRTVFSVDFSPDGKMLALGGGQGVLKIYSLPAGEEQQVLAGHPGKAIDTVVFSPDGKYLATGGRDNAVKLWEVSTGKELATLKGHTDLVHSVAFSPDAMTLVSGSYDKTIRLWDLSTYKELCTLEGHNDSIEGVAFCLGGKVLASGSSDNTVRLWDVGTRKAKRVFHIR